MEQFIQNILVGVRQWVNGKLDDITYVISSHINELTDRVEALEQGGGMEAGTGISISGKTISLSDERYTTAEKEKLAAIEAGAEVNVIEVVKVNGTALTVDTSDRSVDIDAITGVKSGDLVLSRDGNDVKSTLSLDYVSSAKTIYLKGVNDAVIDSIDCTDFIKDGMLDSATLNVRSGGTWTPPLPAGVEDSGVTTDGTYIVLVWNTDSGKEAMFIDVTTLIDIYTAGAGLQLVSGEFSVTPATANAIGGVKIGRDISVESDGTIFISGATVEEVLAVLKYTGSTEA